MEPASKPGLQPSIALLGRRRWDVKLDGADFQKLLVPLTEEEVEAVNALTREELLAELRSENALMPQPRKRRKPGNHEACAHLSQMLTSVTECSCMLQGSALRATIA